LNTLFFLCSKDKERNKNLCSLATDFWVAGNRAALCRRDIFEVDEGISTANIN